jgi:hypothetical protein
MIVTYDHNKMVCRGHSSMFQCIAIVKYLAYFATAVNFMSTATGANFIKYFITNSAKHELSTLQSQLYKLDKTARNKDYLFKHLTLGAWPKILFNSGY